MYLSSTLPSFQTSETCLVQVFSELASGEVCSCTAENKKLRIRPNGQQIQCLASCLSVRSKWSRSFCHLGRDVQQPLDKRMCDSPIHSEQWRHLKIHSKTVEMTILRTKLPDCSAQEWLPGTEVQGHFVLQMLAAVEWWVSW